MSFSEIMPGVYVGDRFVANDEQFFRRRNIVRVVNCTEVVPFYFPQLARYFRVPVDDSSGDADNNVMAAYMLPAIRFIMEGRPSGERGVLIHCQAGVSRSCTVAVGLLRFCCFPTIAHAIRALVDRRNVAFFGGRYLNFEKALYKVFGK